MATYNEVAYMIKDELQITSDDSIITKEHIIFLMDKYRSLFLKKYYLDIKKAVPESNYQTICLNLEKVDGIEGDTCSGTYLRSIETIPDSIGVTIPRVSTMDFLSGEITYISKERLKFVGHNKYLKNIIYCSIGPDNKLYMKSSNPQAYYLDKIEISGVFENSVEASKLSCDYSCDIKDMKYPLEEALIPLVIESIVKEISGVIYRPTDDNNNANDDLANKATRIPTNK